MNTHKRKHGLLDTLGKLILCIVVCYCALAVYAWLVLL